MTRWKVWTLAVAAAGAAAAWGAVTPVAHGQTVVRARGGQPQIFEIFGGASRIGISVEDVDEEEMKRAKLPSLAGAVITDVEDGTPAATAGFKTGDVIVEFDGERVRSARQLTRLVQETPSGRKVLAIVIRDGQRVTLSVEPRAGSRRGGFDKWRELEDFARDYRYEVAPPPSPPAPPSPRGPRPPRPPRLDDWMFGRTNSRLGLTVDTLSEQLAQYFGTKEGVLVTTVRDDSAAAKAGIKAGDVITSINGTRVDSPDDVRRSVQRLEDDAEFTVEIVRDRKPMTLKGKVGSDERRRTFRSIV
ncbi:MAG TPA: PDZ domain-containing protein [Vicinamibacterales bacterium]|nr:PDZ domain-containing protein [Vicinamibacterales bacterium]